MADLNKLNPVFRCKVELILHDLRLLGWQPIVAESVRTRAEQAEKVRRGYSKTMKSWHVESTIGMLPLAVGSYEEVHGGAVDIVDRRYRWGGLARNVHFRFWSDLGWIAKKHGCEWGGDWATFKDVAHVQMRWIETRPMTSAYA